MGSKWLTPLADEPVRADRVIPLDPAAGLDRRTPAHWRRPSRVVAAQPGFEGESQSKTDLYQRVTDQIVLSLEQGVHGASKLVVAADPRHYRWRVIICSGLRPTPADGTERPPPTREPPRL